jgi:hypothetical protein
LGDDEAALSELGKAVERNRELLDRANTDEAFMRLREHPDWPR